MFINILTFATIESKITIAPVTSYFQGILLRNGYWYNLERNSWTVLRFPSYAPFIEDILDQPDTLWSFRGKPTMFGNMENCNTEGVCDYDEVMQYDDASNMWVSLGRMTESKTFHDVVEVPQSFCDAFRDSHEAKKQTEKPKEKAKARPDDATTVAMIVGGYDDNRLDNDRVHTSVEVYGCPDVDYYTIQVDDYPKRIYGSAGRFYVEPADGVEKVLSCGGFSTNSGVNLISEQCYEFIYETGLWQEAPYDLQRNKWAHIMAMIPDLESEDLSQLVPSVMGLRLDTEIFQPGNRTWREYYPLEETNWWTLGCFIQYMDKVYQIRNEVNELDPSTWNITPLDVVPEFLRSPGKCTGVEVDGHPGNDFFTRLMLVSVIAMYVYARYDLTKCDDYLLQK